MSDALGMAAQLARQSLRFGWFLALNRLVDRRTDSLGAKRAQVPSWRTKAAEKAQGA